MQQDKRWRIVRAKMRRVGYRSDPESLLEVMRAAQRLFGYLDDPSMEFIAEGLSLPASAVRRYAVFYQEFVTKPEGKHTCVVCSGAACYAQGAVRLLAQLEDQLGVRAGQTSADGYVSLLSAQCVGICNAAPAVVVDERLQPGATAQAVIDVLRSLPA